MRQKAGTQKASAEQVVKDIRRATRKQYGAEEKIRIVLEGLRGEESIAALCRREGIAESLYYSWSKEFLEAGKKRLAGDTARAATSDEVKVLRKETRDLKKAFDVFRRGLGTWWPANRSIGSSPLKIAIIEPRTGGRWYEIERWQRISGAKCSPGMSPTGWCWPGGLASIGAMTQTF